MRAQAGVPHALARIKGYVRTRTKMVVLLPIFNCELGGTKFTAGGYQAEIPQQSHCCMMSGQQFRRPLGDGLSKYAYCSMRETFLSRFPA